MSIWTFWTLTHHLERFIHIYSQSLTCYYMTHHFDRLCSYSCYFLRSITLMCLVLVQLSCKKSLLLTYMLCNMTSFCVMLMPVYKNASQCLKCTVSNQRKGGGGGGRGSSARKRAVIFFFWRMKNQPNFSNSASFIKLQWFPNVHWNFFLLNCYRTLPLPMQRNVVESSRWFQPRGILWHSLELERVSISVPRIL